jgi:hypothetical protein
VDEFERYTQTPLFCTFVIPIAMPYLMGNLASALTHDPRDLHPIAHLLDAREKVFGNGRLRHSAAHRPAQRLPEKLQACS